MKKLIGLAALAVSFVAGAALSAEVRDTHDLEAVHVHVTEAINEMQHARAANHYDMKGHGAKAEEHLKAAERELTMAIEAAKAAK